ncbi:MAG: serine--tRNA ligase [Bacteroidetes bacterium]|nr:serine--tRNA ligase [Bacteroidota bacterium]
MIQLNHLRNNPEEVLTRLLKRGIDATKTIDTILETDKLARESRVEMEYLQNRSNVVSKEIGELMRKGQAASAEPLKSESTGIKDKLKSLEERVESLEESVRKLLITLPNAPHSSVPTGKDSNDNVEIFIKGEKPALPANALPHWELAKKYDLIDFELGVKISGAGFPVYKGKGAKLQRALIQYFMNEAEKAGYLEIQPPIVINEASGFGTGQLPDKDGQMYYIGEDELYLIPTAEVPITNLYRDVILNIEDLPIKNFGYTPCFRREAGSYGAHVRGLNRLHQFDKVEIVQIVKPELSYAALEDMQLHVQQLLQNLGLHYRVLLLCGGDMSVASAKTYDLEVWSGAQQMWLECSSVSNCETYQTNRLKCRFRNDQGKMELAHSLNGSALALPRIIASILENYQTENSIMVPEVLRSYTGFNEIK